MNVKSNDRITIVGKTGSGKTYLAKHLFRQYRRIIFFDPKRENSGLGRCYADLPGLCGAIDSGSFPVVFQPFDLKEEDFDAFCKKVFEKGNICILMDEIYFVAYPRVCAWHEKLIRMGRSRGIGLIHLTQRPSYIDNFLLSEAEHIFIFRLQLESDRKKMEGIVGEDLTVPMRQMHDYEFIYYNHKEGMKVFQPIAPEGQPAQAGILPPEETV